jgi:small nuclear ribonucleoprotein B and B'
MRVTLQDSRQLVGQMLAYDRHMNLVLADTEEFRRIKRKQNKSAAPGGSSAGQTVVQEEKRTLGLVIVRGAHIISLTVESPPPADPSARLGKTTTGGIASTLQAGPGVARPAGRGAAAPISLAGPAAGVGGAAPPPGFPSFPGAPGAPGAPGFPGRGARKSYCPLHLIASCIGANCCNFSSSRLPWPVPSSRWFPRCSWFPWRPRLPSWRPSSSWIQPPSSTIKKLKKLALISAIPTQKQIWSTYDITGYKRGGRERYLRLLEKWEIWNIFRTETTVMIKGGVW